MSMFQTWYPQYRSNFQIAVEQNCSESYSLFLQPELCNGSREDCAYLAKHVVDCVLAAITPSVLADCQAAAVILGLLPTVLSFAGSSNMEFGLLASRRPVLAFLLAAASPATMPLRASDYHGAVRMLSKNDDKALNISATSRWQVALSFAQYIVALANIANLVTTLADISTLSVSAVASDLPYLFAIWALVALAQYIIGAICFRLSVETWSDDETSRKWGILSFLRRELRPSASESQAQMHISYRKTTAVFLCLEWFTSLLLVCNIINGTLIFASSLFVGTLDAVTIAARLLGSTLISRMVLMFELHGLTQNLAGGVQSAVP